MSPLARRFLLFWCKVKIFYIVKELTFDTDCKKIPKEYVDEIYHACVEVEKAARQRGLLLPYSD